QAWFGMETCYLNPGFNADTMEMYLRFMGVGNSSGTEGPTGYAEPFYANYRLDNNHIGDVILKADEFHMSNSYRNGGVNGTDWFTMGPGDQANFYVPLFAHGGTLTLDGASGARFIMQNAGASEVQFQDGSGTALWEFGTTGASPSPF